MVTGAQLDCAKSIILETDRGASRLERIPRVTTQRSNNERADRRARQAPDPGTHRAAGAGGASQ